MDFYSFIFFLLLFFSWQIVSPSSSFAVKQGGILRVAVGMNPTLPGDPPNTNANGDLAICCHVFEQLVTFQYDEKKKTTMAVPGLAEKWVLSKDRKVWTFYIRKGVTFHDGTPCDAAAVKFNMDRFCADPPPFTPGM